MRTHLDARKADAHAEAHLDALLERQEDENGRAEAWLDRHHPQPERYTELLYPDTGVAADDDEPF